MSTSMGPIAHMQSDISAVITGSSYAVSPASFCFELASSGVGISSQYGATGAVQNETGYIR